MKQYDYPTGKDLDDLIGRYTLDDPAGQRCLEITVELLKKIAEYTTISGAYGIEILKPHLESISIDGAQFMKALGYSATAQSNFRNAYVLSDIGKIHPDYDETDWMAKESTSRDKVDKSFRRLHTIKGADLLNSALAGEPREVQDHPHWRIVKSLMVYHHERMDGKGEFRLSGEETGTIMQIACMVDAYDGDMRKRAHQTTERTPEVQLQRMAGQDEKKKYDGAFEPKLLARYTDYKISGLQPAQEPRMCATMCL